MVNKGLVEVVGRGLCQRGFVFLQSDVLGVAREMKMVFEERGDLFVKVGEGEKDEEWLRENPMEVRTEREMYVLEKGLPVYRAMFRKL